jgi:RNA recognition motif-containing protein
MSKRLYVGNLSYDATEMDLRDAFAAAGTVEDVKVVLDRDTGRPRGFAFVEMSTEQEAQAAIAHLNGRELGGRPMRVSEAQERPTRARGPSRPGGRGGVGSRW